MSATRRGLIRGTIAALFAPAAAAAPLAGAARVHPLEWKNLTANWRALDEREGRLWVERDRLAQWEARLIHNTARFNAEVRRRERILDLKERFGSAFVSTIEWPAVDEWGRALARS